MNDGDCSVDQCGVEHEHAAGLIRVQRLADRLAGRHRIGQAAGRQRNLNDLAVVRALQTVAAAREADVVRLVHHAEDGTGHVGVIEFAASQFAGDSVVEPVVDRGTDQPGDVGSRVEGDQVSPAAARGNQCVTQTVDVRNRRGDTERAALDAVHDRGRVVLDLRFARELHVGQAEFERILLRHEFEVDPELIAVRSVVDNAVELA